MKEKPVLICVVGPTAIGKTKLAIEIAKHYNTEILSVDSRQFYKEMTIGTAVPTEEELAAAPHHFIQDRSIFQDYSVGDFEIDALQLLDKLFLKHQVLVMVGGSGLYVDAVTKGLNKFPDIPKGIRETLNSIYLEQGIEPLQNELKLKDPDYYESVDLQNHHRIIRALEVCRASNTCYSSFLNAEKDFRSFSTIYIGLTADREVIYDRINKRVDIMVEEGLIEEAQKLYPYKDLNALQTVGYKELFSFIDGTYTKEKAIEEIKKNTRRFAKRQATWFRKNKAIEWFDYTTPIKVIINTINNTLAKN